MKTIKKSGDVTKIETYETKYKEWYKQKTRPDPNAGTQATELAAKKTALDSAEAALPAKTNKEVLIKNIEKREDFQYFKVQNFDEQDLNKDGCDAAKSVVPASECKSSQKSQTETISKNYLIADAKYDEIKAHEDEVANLVKKAEDVVDAKTFASITTCDQSAGLVHKTYDGAKCEGTPEKTFTASWGACTKAPDGTYVKITGAAALQAAAVALVAFAGSQF